MASKTITFAQQVKEELVNNPYDSKERLRALLAAFIRITGSLSFINKESVINMSTENAKIAKFIYSHLKDIYDADVSFSYTQKSINKKRIYKSLKLLATTELSIQEIGDLVGVGNTSYFHTLFKKEIGLSPKQYRAQLKGS